MFISNIIFIILVIGIVLCIIIRFMYYFYVKNEINEISKNINYKINPGEIVESNDSIVLMRGYLTDNLIDSLYLYPKFEFLSLNWKYEIQLVSNIFFKLNRNLFVFLILFGEIK